MADEDILTPANAPKIGDPLRLSVRIAPNRQVLMPDQIVIAGATGIGMEMIFLRNELVMSAQIGTVIGIGPTGVEVQHPTPEMGAQIFDIGHVRVQRDAAVELAINILRHSIQNEGMDSSEILERLNRELIDVK